MGFVFTQKETEIVKKKDYVSADFKNQQILQMAWETTPEAYQAVLPPIFEPVGPLVFAFVGNYPDANFTNPYMECGLSVPVKYKGELGFYFLAMPIDAPAGCNGDLAIACGREMYGYPKKQCAIKLQRNGKMVEASISRNQVEFFRAQVELTGKTNEKEGMDYLAVDTESEDFLTRLSYNLRHRFDIWNNKIEISNVELTKCYCEIRVYNAEYGEGDIQLAYAYDDPWADLPVKRVLGARWGIQDLSMAKGSAEPLDAEEMYPYVLPRIWDSSFFKILDHVPWR